MSNFQLNRQDGTITFDGRMFGKNTSFFDLLGVGEVDVDGTKELISHKIVSSSDAMLCSFVVIFRNRRVLCYQLIPSVDNESWESVSAKDEERKLGFLVHLLKENGLENFQEFTWGHVIVKYSGNSGFSSLTVAYYKAKNKSLHGEAIRM